MSEWYQMQVDEVLAKLNTSTAGLSAEEARKRLQQYGENKLLESKARSRFSIFLSQFKDLMILILLAAAVISFFIGEVTDAMVIIAIIIANAIVGYIQEYKAEKSIQMLQKMAAQHAIAWRDGAHHDIEASELVPGDIIALEAGNVVPADARVIETQQLRTEEAPLTGESHSVDKTRHAITEKNLVAADQLNMVFKGTIVSSGSGTAVITATGMQTEMGRIAGMLTPESQQTPLQKRLAKFSRQLAVLVVIICIVVFITGWLQGKDKVQMFMTALSLAVAALPEALPAVITILLAKGAARMARQNALIRKLPAVETLGSVTFICSDKTGTLTQNKMTVVSVEPASDQEALFLKAMAINNELKRSEAGEWLGDSTEIALVNHAMEKGAGKAETEVEMELLHRLPFDSDRMRMSTIHRYGEKIILLTKGAPSRIVEVLKIDEDTKQKILERNRELAAKGQRVLCFAYKEFDELPGTIDHSLENGLNYLGIAGMIDPPREEVIAAIEECRQAGIQSVMITGDQPLTAKAIARELRIIDTDDASVLTGKDLLELEDQALAEKVKDTKLYARVSPEQKLRIVNALQQNRQFVAMTGDGVNDAPSLKKADIGVAMGITGTDVSKEAAHMILLDDNFATIVKAVKEGRRIYNNIRKFIQYVLACNLGEILTIFLAPFFGLPIPILPIHILWINLVTDGLPGLALTAEPAEKDIMKQKPRPPMQNFFAGGMSWQIITAGVILAAAALGIQFWAIENDYSHREQQTIVFTVLCLDQLSNALAVRSNSRSIFTINVLNNKLMIGALLLTFLLQILIVFIPALQPVFKTAFIDLKAAAAIAIVMVASMVLRDLTKIFIARKYRDG
ncbi:MAG TPA: cation-translocating P-type ATPase [Chitinophagaceae bacterium]